MAHRSVDDTEPTRIQRRIDRLGPLRARIGCRTRGRITEAIAASFSARLSYPVPAALRRTPRSANQITSRAERCRSGNDAAAVEAGAIGCSAPASDQVGRLKSRRIGIF